VPESLIADKVNTASLFGRVLAIVAHPDDESIGCGLLLQRTKHATVVFATDGAPNDPKFWKSYSSRGEYVVARRDEAHAAAANVGIKQIHFLDIADQELFRHLPKALAQLRAILTAYQPDALLTHAYEGGHPDHDACAFLVSLLSQEHRLPAWEMPLYHRAAGDRTVQRFISPANSSAEVALAATPQELQRKRAMIASYKSQGDFLNTFDIAHEVFRPQLAYDFSRPPHQGTLNYEEWRWPMKGSEVSQVFSAMLSERKAHAQGR
jgi:LmbE family N-acetylglucosaminyl deacetylase